MEFEFKDMLQALKSVLSPKLTKPDFVCHFFNLIMDVSESQDPLYSGQKEKSSAEKLFSSGRITAKKAQIVLDNWYPGDLEEELSVLEDHQIELLISKLSSMGFDCTKENYVDKICSWLLEFFKDRAKDTEKKSNNDKSKSEIREEFYNDCRTQTVIAGTIVNQYGQNPINIQSIDKLVMNFGGDKNEK